jgi:hypothetical protein
MLVSSKTVGAIQLITSHGGLTLREGDFFVFDANRGHVWVSNARCVIAQIPVSKLSPKLQTLNHDPNTQHPSPSVNNPHR